MIKSVCIKNLMPNFSVAFGSVSNDVVHGVLASSPIPGPVFSWEVSNV